MSLLCVSSWGEGSPLSVTEQEEVKQDPAAEQEASGGLSFFLFTGKGNIETSLQEPD